jgi:predicted nucleic acid-binding protein
MSKEEVLRYERDRDSVLWTSQLTLGEYAVKYYDKYRKAADCEDRVDEALTNIRSIANVQAISDQIHKSAARYMSVWGELRRIPDPPLPRDRKFRWDAIHLATANHVRAARVYVFDRGWEDFPKAEIPNIGTIYHPPRVPEPMLPLG